MTETTKPYVLRLHGGGVVLVHCTPDTATALLGACELAPWQLRPLNGDHGRSSYRGKQRKSRRR